MEYCDDCKQEIEREQDERQVKEEMLCVDCYELAWLRPTHITDDNEQLGMGA